MQKSDGRSGGTALSDAKRALLEKRLRGQAAGAARPRDAITRRESAGPPPLSFAQERLWVLDQLLPGSSVYNIAAVSYLEGPLDVDVLERTVQEILRRHEALRTIYPQVDGEPVQRLLDPSDFRVELEEIPEMPEAERDAYVRRRTREEGSRPFDLTTGPLFRVRLYRLSPTRHAFHTIKHHIVTDGWSMGALSHELEVIYKAFAAGEPSPLPELPIQYADYAAWQREYLTGETLKRQVDYWREHLAGVPNLEMPTDRPRPPVESHRGAFHRFLVPEEVTAALSALCRREGVTLNMAITAAWAVLLARYAGQEDFAVGTLIGNRNRAETERLIGYFVNTAALRMDLSGDPGYREFLRRVRGVLLDADAHQDLPFERVVEELRPPRDLSRHPLFQAMFFLHAFVVQNAPMPNADLGGVTFASFDPESGIALQDTGAAKFDLLLGMVELGGVLSAILEYATDLFDAATAERMASHLVTLLAAAAADPDACVWDLPLASAGELRELEALSAASPGASGRPDGRCVHDLVEAQARRTPGAVALAAGEARVTYAELDTESRRIARFLRSAGVGPETRVGILLERTPAMVAALLGVLRAGGAYVPLDPGHPRERIAFALEDSGARVVLTQDSLADALPSGHGAEIVRLDADRGRIDAAGEDDAPPAVDPGNAAYLIYTSGSTGRPKGVVVTHGAATGFLEAVRERPGISPDDTLVAVTTLAFDISVLELFAPLAAGARVVLADRATAADPVALAGLLAASGATVMQATPATWRMLLLAGWEGEPGLRVLSGGEALPGELADRLRERCAAVWNLYGPTEATVWATTHRVERSEPTVSLGGPLANTRAYVLDARLGPVPVGVPGELYLAGAGVARGYHGRADLTAERFLPNPAAGAAGARMYRTGDRARRREDGELEFLGRVDQQVKIRGYRIEPGEVEAVLRGHPAVREAVVVAREDTPGERRLVGYVVPAADAGAGEAELRGWLRESLPDYMVPAAFVPLEALPLTPNGKLDRSALPAPEATGAGASEYVAPRGPTEEALAEIWAEVLRRDRVGARDDFFALGGHSLMATQVISRVRVRLGAELQLREMFSASTLEAFARRVEAAAREGAGTDAPPLVPVPRDRPIPASFAQQRLWIIHQMDPESSAYNMPLALRLRGALDTGAMARALDALRARHESLRTVFAVAGGAPVQVVEPARPLPLAVEDLRALPEERRGAAAAERGRAEAATPFDLERGPLLRARLLRLGDEEWELLLTLHHVVTDGWSTGILLRELSALYTAFARGGEARLPALPVQYPDYAAWQRSWLAGDALERQLAYWRERLADAPPLLELPTERPRPPVQSPRGAHRGLVVPERTTAALRELARREGATLFMTLLAVWQALLGRWSGQEDVSVGSPIAGRTRAELEGLIGFFVNTLVLRTDLSGAPGLRGLLARVAETTLGAYAHQDIPFEKLVEELQPERSLRYTPLFQVIFVLQNNQRGELDLGGLRAEAVGRAGETTQFDLSLALAEDGGRLVGLVSYRAELFDADTVDRMLGHYLALLERAAAEPDRPLAELPILADAELEEVLVRWNRAAADPPADLRVHELVEAQARRTPDAVALVAGGAEVTYAELDRESGRIAGLLRSAGVGPEVRVGILLERTTAMVAALLGVLRAGGAYVPLDPAYPRGRLAYMLSDSGAAMLLTQERLAGLLPEFGGEVVLVDGGAPHATAPGAGAPGGPPAAVSPGNLAYVVYTSGSTGAPKGVMVEHAAVAGRLAAAARIFGPGSGTRLLGTASLSFDASVLEVFLPLVAGGTLHLAAREDVLAPEALGALLRERRVDSWVSTPALLASLEEANFPELRTVSTGGERCPGELAARWSRGRRLLNMYGPTETTVFATFHECVPGSGAAPPIGSPAAGARAYVLDPRGSPVPVGVPGELYLGGGGLARGYLGRPGLTAERFLPDPFGGEAGGRLYRTGDRARRRADGELEYLGRVDRQVKVRGFRIEPGEIEALLRSHPAVREAVVAAREDRPGERRLVGYVVPEAGAAPGEAELHGWLRERLPEYMLPAAVVAMDAFPLTPSGKLDHGALPAPEAVGAGAREYVAPRGPVEAGLAEIWAEVLRRERIGAHDDFFALGGHSLMATQVISRVRDRLGADLQLRELFEASSLDAFARRVEAAMPAATPADEEEGSFAFPLSFAQQRLWFLDQMAPGSTAYNVTAAYHLRGGLDAAALERALDEVRSRHESLRTVFRERGGEPVQVVLPWRPAPLPVTELSGMPRPEQEAATDLRVAEIAGTPFDLAAGPLFRAELVRLGPEEHVLAFGMHHVVSDGWSMGVLNRELRTLYEAFAAGLPSPLPELEIQYADYAVWQREQLVGEALERQVAFWRDALQGAPVLDLPADRPRPPVQTFNGAARELLFPRALVERLRAVGEREGATPFMVLMAAWQLLLARWSGQDDVVVGTPVAGRGRREIEGLIGFFVNTLAIRVDLSGRPDFRELVRRVREASFAAFAHQDLPFEKIVEELKPERDPGRPPVFQVVFALQNAPGDAMASPGLEWSGWRGEGRTAKYDLSLVLVDTPDGLAGVLEYNTDLFDPDTAERMAAQLRTVLESVAADPSAVAADLPLLAPGERELLAGWSVSGAPGAPARCVHELFAEQAARVPGKTALVFGAGRVAYSELDRRSDALALRLSALGVGPDARVGLCMERSPAMVAALLAVLKAGGAYVPLDPEYPDERLAFMLADAGARVLLTSAELRDRFAGFEGEIVEVNDVAEDAGALSHSRTPALSHSLSPDDLACVIYTSGSTGEPKGIEVPHRAIPGFFLGADYARFDGWQVTLQHSPVSWDALTLELWTALLTGGTCVLQPGRGGEPEELERQVREHGVDTLWLTSAYFDLVVDTRPGALAGVRQLLVGGEALSPAHVRRALEAYPELRLVDGYGPSECTVFSACHVVPREWDGHAVPIGRPVGDRRVHVLDAYLEPVPVGVPGELCVGGPAVARGYLGRPEPTAERFVPDPFAAEPGARLFRSGDRARWRADGTLEFLGRLDRQAKVRGFRVEPAEVEAALARLPGVARAAAVVREDAPGDRRLVGYAVAGEGAALTGAGLRAALARSLPEHLVPSAVVVLDALPLTPRGKLDRRALPAPDASSAAEAAFVAPRTPLEERIAAIWREVLRVERVGVHDRFFDLGGHSLLATQVVTRIREELRAELPLRVLFERPTVADLAARVEAERAPEPDDGRIVAQARAGRGRRAARRPQG